MKGLISLRTHNILDYIGGVVLLTCPSIFGFSDIEMARSVFITLGFVLIGYSLLTRYPFSFAKVIPLGVHMGLDVTLGVLMLVAPWVFGYSDYLTGGQLGLHFILGLGVITLVAFTRPRSERQEALKEPMDIEKAA